MSEWCNLTPAMRFHFVNTAIVWPCYLATNFKGGTRGHSDGGRAPGHPI